MGTLYRDNRTVNPRVDPAEGRVKTSRLTMQGRRPAVARWGLFALLLGVAACPPPGPAGPRRTGRSGTHRAQRRPPASVPRAEAFVITSAEDLLGGPGATGRVGDVRLDNGRVAFVIEALDRRWGFALGGGNLVDAGLSRGGGDALAQMFTYFGEFPRQAIYERLSIRTERDGTAVVKVEGHDSKDRNLEVSTEYALRPLVDFLEISTVVENRGTEAVELPLGDAIQWGGLRAFAPGHGFGVPHDPGVPWIAGIGTDVTVGYGTYQEPIRGPSGSSWTDTILTVANLHPGGSAAYDRILVVRAGPDAARVASRVHTLRGDALGTIQGRVQDRAGRSVLDARIELRGADGKLQAITAPDADGHFLAQLPPGAYGLRAVAPGRAGGDDVVTTLGASASVRVDLSLSAQSHLRYRLRELARGRTDDLVSGKLTIEGLAGTSTPDLGPRFRTRGGNVVYTATGQGSIPLAPGRYRVTASRGPEYALSVSELAVPEGGSAALDAELRRVVDSQGFACGDFHQHTVGSSDAATTIRDRVISNVGEGVEIAVASDHNVVTDFATVIASLGVGRDLFSIQGNEVTTDTSPRPVGHFNVFPVPRDAAAPGGGAWDVFALLAPDLFALARADGADRVVQVNHPRATDNGFFALAGYDPRTNRGRPGMWAADFDAVEVFNSSRIERVPAILTDVYAMWNRGLTPAITGSSDTHSIIGEEPGFPRTCLAVGDDPSTLTEQAIVDALKRTRNGFVTNGPYPRFRVEGVDVGGLARARAGRVTVEIEVQAAPWIDVRTIQLVVNGEPEEPVVIAPPAAAEPPVVRWRGTLRPRLRRDAWIQLIVRGDRSLAPVVQHDPADGPLALTNPIWVDVDGNGRFDPPIAPEAELAEPAAPRPPGAPAHLPRVNPADR